MLKQYQVLDLSFEKHLLILQEKEGQQFQKALK